MDTQQRAALLVKRAEINLDMQDIPAALQDLQAAIEKDPTYVKSYLVRSRIGFITKEFDVTKDIQKALELDPLNEEAQAMFVMDHNTQKVTRPSASSGCPFLSSLGSSTNLSQSGSIASPHCASPHSTPPHAHQASLGSSTNLSQSGSIAAPHCASPHSNPPHAHQGSMPLYLLSNNQKYTVPSSVIGRATCPELKVNTTDCRERLCTASRMDMDYVITDISNIEVVTKEAKEWLALYYKEKKLPEESLIARMNEVCEEIQKTGTYFQTYDELAYSCKVAWRNSPRCINRVQWSRMEVIDCRKVTTAEGVFQKCLEHLRFATNGGNIITTITVFAQQRAGQPGARIWNSQLLRYAGYQQPDGTIIGDPANVEMTEAAQKLGWVGQGTRFDVLPIIIQMPNEEAKWFAIPPEYALTVPMQHPRYTWFEELRLQWFAVPFVSNIGLTSGGVQYTCTPFNGWFMGTELSRNLGDLQRYNMLTEIAIKMGLDPGGPPSSLWQEKANVELNIAILHSFARARVSMVDHHTAAQGFLTFYEAEHAAGRPVPGDWVWLVPPCAGSVSPIFHLEMVNFLQKPNYFPMDFPGKNYNFPRQKRRTNVSIKGLGRMILFSAKLMATAMRKRHRVRVLFATETGNSERYAQRVAKFLSSVAVVKLDNMENYDADKLHEEEVVIYVASTFGSGDAPSCAVTFKEKLESEKKQSMRNIQFAVFGLGSTLYPNFAAFGAYLDHRMAQLGASRIVPLAKGDEMTGSETPFKKWMGSLWAQLGRLWGITQADYDHGLKTLGISLNGSDKNTFTANYELVPCKPHDKHSPTSTTYNRSNPYIATLKDNIELIKNKTEDRSTRQIVLDIASENSMKFRAGDHLAVLPSNRADLVEELLDLLHVKEPDTYYKIENINGADTLDTPFTTLPFTIREAFTDFIDITSPPKPDFLAMLAYFAVHPGDKTQLQDLSKGHSDYETWVQHFSPTLPELFNMFPISIPLELLLEKLPHIQPRFYSISSSPTIHPTEVHLTVGVLKYQTPSGKKHFGVASNFLANAKSGENVRVFVRHSDFSLPSSPSTPLLLIGPGTGIAPFRSFWQERANVQDVGPAALFFGCRSRNEDLLYENELEKAKEDGYLEHTFFAFSRETEKKVYVQDKLLQESNLVWDLLNKGAHVYVCGDATMANGVKETLKQIAFSKGENNKYIEDLIATKRYSTDVYGATLQTKKSLQA